MIAGSPQVVGRAFRRRNRRVPTALAVLVPGVAALAILAWYQPWPHATPKPTAAARARRAALAIAPERLTTDPTQLEKVSPADAVSINAAIPIATIANPAPPPLIVPFAKIDAWSRSLDCMTAAVYYEAGYEPDTGQRAVAQVVLNRVRHPAYPKNVCGVVFQGHERPTGCQFTFTCDGSLARPRAALAWERARHVAAAALAGSVYAPVGWATNYHADYVVPYWASTLVKTAIVGRHIFYRLPGNAGSPLAFSGRYAGDEALDLATLSATAAQAAALTAGVAGSITPVADRPILANDGPGFVPQASPGIADPLSPPRPSARWVIGAGDSPSDERGDLPALAKPRPSALPERSDRPATPPN